MRHVRRVILTVIATCLASAFSLPAFARAVHPPATPLVVVHPCFSVWSFADRLTDEATRHWTGKPQPLSLQAHIDGKVVRLADRDPRQVPALDRVAL